MSTIVEFTVPAEDFALGAALSGTGATMLELERIVPTGKEVMPFVWVKGDDLDAFEEKVQGNPNVESITQLDHLGNRRLYRIAWEETPTNLLRGFIGTGATILEASGGDTWEFRLRFPDHDHLTQFNDFCVENDIPVNVDRVYSPTKESSLDEQFGLTPKERKALQLAFDRGYFATPRQTELGDLATDLDISRQALSKRVRRATEKVLQTALTTDDSE